MRRVWRDRLLEGDEVNIVSYLQSFKHNTFKDFINTAEESYPSMIIKLGSTDLPSLWNWNLDP